ncbi:glycosyltransferase family 2 protein [Alicyclobacillus tolerans]|uniref:GT2 family glycosyltransferase n=1 Tax=Alicyclobacillus tolerans TaxID=90970 RepID=A0ABT9LV37_9BACL|nr:glycosyltransferase family 2 protein [Alicyclobacillus tengchongensis]MDP9728098.1 GT2 family glycosyltransferase [Alicyclobacillus tengchongensis]
MRMRIEKKDEKYGLADYSSSNQPIVQVQMVTYNHENWIERTLLSILHQTYPLIRILVIDNNSSDQTVSKIHALFPDIEVIENQRNIGYSAAHNLGFQNALESDIEWVMTINPDVELLPDYVEKIMYRIHDFPDAGGFTGKLLRGKENPDNQIIDSTGLVKGPFFHVFDRGANCKDSPSNSSSNEVWGVCGAAAIYFLPMFMDIQMWNGNYFDESFFIYKEDVDVCWRSQIRGWKFYYIADAVAYHNRGWKKNSPPSQLAIIHSFANQIALLMTYAENPLYKFLCMMVEFIRLMRIFIVHPSLATQILKKIFKQYQFVIQKKAFYRENSEWREVRS